MGASASAIHYDKIFLNEDECKTGLKELFDKNIFEAYCDNDHMISIASIQQSFTDRTDVFLTHDWGMELGMDNHARVSKVNEALKRRGLKTWFDSEKMEGNVKKKMVSGIENANCIVVFVTKRYMEKVGGDNAEDNCQLEFCYAARRKTGRRMVPVVMEARMRNTLSWTGEVGMVLGGSLYVDLASEESFEARMDELASRVISITGTTIKKVMEDNDTWKRLIEPKIHNISNATSTVEISSQPSDALEIELSTWIRANTKIVQKFAVQYAKRLVDEGIGSIDKLRKKLTRNPNYLNDLDIDEDDADELASAVVGQASSTKTSTLKSTKSFQVKSSIYNIILTITYCSGCL
jgi:hypothetical protein